jgi:hypothetical protein
MNWRVTTLRERQPYIERPYLELPTYQPIGNSLARGLEHCRTLLRQLAIKLDGLVWRVRDLSGAMRLAIFSAHLQSFVTLGCEETFRVHFASVANRSDRFDDSTEDLRLAGKRFFHVADCRALG